MLLLAGKEQSWERVDGDMLVCSADCVWKIIMRTERKAWDVTSLSWKRRTVRSGIGVIDYGKGNGSDSRHHVLEPHQRNNCWALELYKPQKACVRETPSSKHWPHSRLQKRDSIFRLLHLTGFFFFSLTPSTFLTWYKTCAKPET